MLTPNGLPYATLVYVWLRNAPAGTVLVSPYSDRVRLFVVESGEERAGQWIDIRRNVVADYRHAFGEDPGDIVAVGVMTDSGDDGSIRRAFYGDITFRGAANEQIQVLVLARRLALLAGRPATFFAAVAAIVLWALAGPVFGYSDTWQLVVNTATTIITFLMVFIIQNTQNRDTEAIQLKLDELIRATQGAHNALLDLEHIDDEKFERYRKSYARLAAARGASSSAASSTPTRRRSRT